MITKSTTPQASQGHELGEALRPTDGLALFVEVEEGAEDPGD